jgi:hypothetical protein
LTDTAAMIIAIAIAILFIISENSLFEGSRTPLPGQLCPLPKMPSLMP